MKSEQTQPILDETQKQAQLPFSKTCQAGHPATQICYDKNCDKNAYICADQSCDCSKEHEACLQLLVNSILKKIKSKVVDFEKFQADIFGRIDKAIDQLSDFKEKIANQMKQNSTVYRLPIKHKDLYCLLNKQNITGKQIFKSFNKVINLDNISADNSSLNIKFEQLWQSVSKQIDGQRRKFFNMMESFKLQTNSEDQFLAIQFLEDYSNILVQSDYRWILLDMFGQKPQKAKLLYRASQNNFSVQKFHEKCDNIPQTLTICETAYGKLIGGYTPLVWRKNGGAQIKDQSGLSFIFSLTNGHKFTLDKKKTAITQNANHGPIFGGSNPDFGISGTLNGLMNPSSGAINQSYFNQNYTNYWDSNNKFTGNANFNLIKEWQVWELQWQYDGWK